VPPGSFYYQPLPAPNAAAVQSVALSFGSVFGNESHRTSNRFEEWGITPTVTWDINNDWQLRGMLNYGDNKSSYSTSELNPTLVQQYAAGTTAATAINPYVPAATTNQALFANLRNWEIPGEAKDKITNIRAIVDGALFELPAGKLRLAAGAEYVKDEFSQRISGGGVPGGLSALPFVVYSRSVKSVFGELQIPIVGAGNAMTGLYELELSLSGRYDKYSDFGNTSNPKIGLSYQPISWITLRGNWGKSFNAPTPVDQLGAQNTSIGAQNFFQVPPPGSPPGTGAGLYVIALQGSTHSLQPQTATTYSLGLDISPPVVPGLRASLSYYHIDYRGTLDKPPVFDAARLFAYYPQYVILSPTQAQIAAYAAQASNPAAIAFLQAPGAPPVYELLDFRTYNLANTKLSGIDISLSYTHDTGFGSIDGQVSANRQVTRYTQASDLSPFTDDLRFGAPVFYMSATLGATIHNLRVQATLNHNAGYNVLRSPTLLQDHVTSFSVLNLFFRYGVDGKGTWRDMAFTLSVNNVLDQAPPVLRTTAAFGDSAGFANGQTVGRLFQVGVSKKF
jgi:iron complex outermembrane receptor protein